MAVATKTVEQKFKSLRKLKRYMHLPDERIMGMAKASLAREPVKVEDPKLDQLLAGKFSSTKEQRQAQDLYDRYLADYNLESPSEQATVRDIVYLEIVQGRLQRKLNQFEDEDIKSVPYDLMDSMHKNADVIVKLKTALGLNKSKDKLHGYDAFEHAKKRHKVWRSENQASRYIKCGHCQRPNLLMMRTDAWEARKHPFFQDNVIYNKHLFAHLGQTLTIDNKFIAGVLNVSPDYIDWVIARRVGYTPQLTGVQNGSSTQTSGQGESQVQQVEVTISAPGG